MSKTLSKNFEKNSKDNHDNLEEVDWLTLAPKRKLICLEDGRAKSERLKREGGVLAESERYWEAISKWEEALALTPEDETLHEMRAQSYLLLNEVYPAVQAAAKCTEVNPLWWVGHQTLGRAQLGLGDVAMAVKSFSRAVHLYPVDEELWKEDLLWAKSLLDQHHTMLGEQEAERSRCTLTEVTDTPARLTAICASPHNPQEGSDLQDSTDNCDPSNTMNENSVHVKVTGKCEEIDDTSDGGGPKDNPGVTCTNTHTDSFRGSEDARETKRIPINYIRMRQWASDRVQK